MINFFTTIGGVFTRLVEVTIAGAPLVNFVFWLTIRDLYYSVCYNTPSCLTTNSNLDGISYRLGIYFFVAVRSGRWCLKAAPAIGVSGRSTARQIRDVTPDRLVLGKYSASISVHCHF